MNIITACKYLSLGYRIKRSSWEHYVDRNSLVLVHLSLDDILGEDWLVIIEGIVKNFPIQYQE